MSHVSRKAPLLRAVLDLEQVRKTPLLADCENHRALICVRHMGECIFARR